MTSGAGVDLVILFDVDNALLDNDRVQQDLREQLAREFGAKARDRYWDILERLREELGYVDYLGALERYRLERLHDPRVLALSGWLVDYPFVERLFPARRYVMVDDKLRILTAIKAARGGRVITVFVRQGHYANDAETTARYPAADMTIGHVGELLRHDLAHPARS